ncbi:MAG: transcriptional regulator [Rhizobiales bacterium]|nr:transcriptional regulator [Hyphomicrobiales bacterium]
MKLSRNVSPLKFISRAALLGALFIASSYAGARAAELIMFEQAGCAWCEAFDREIAPVYDKTEEGARAPLRRVNIAAALPSDLDFIAVERLTPLFVLVDNGREIGRIRGYPGDDHFWGLLGVLIKSLESSRTGGERVHLLRKTLRATD